ncbi:Rhodanese-like domain-containing protein [Paenibacillaceae bacterium GAS479]|nr:Rhodanese-like domain-containing protein [Paenibacillaceae bacterium GAS479]
MRSNPIVSMKWLLARMYESDLVIVDCRFALGKSDSGRNAYEAAHIPGAVYLDLERDLSAPVGKHGGRHPLPEPEVLEVALRRAGIGPDSRVVAYDDQGGAMASRLWWLLRWLGHDAVFVMDESFSAWQAEGFPVTDETRVVVPGRFEARVQPQLLAGLDEVRAASAAAAPEAWGSAAGEAGSAPGAGAGGVAAPATDAIKPANLPPLDRLSAEASLVEGLEAAFGAVDEPTGSSVPAAGDSPAAASERPAEAAPLLLDSREPRRYAGLEEPIDHKAGHIPGAVNQFWKGVLDEQGRWKTGDALAAAFSSIPRDRELIVYCGSGVTACPNVLALQAAGYSNVKLYAGSWSDWISYSENPVAAED